jgi:hypothetical protein
MGHNDGSLADHHLHNGPLGMFIPHPTNSEIGVVFINHLLMHSKWETRHSERKAKCEDIFHLLITRIYYQELSFD